MPDLRTIEAAQQVQRAGLAGAVGADDAGDGAGCGREGDILHGAHAAERNREICDVEARTAAGPRCQDPQTDLDVASAVAIRRWRCFAGRNFAASCSISPTIPLGATRSTAKSSTPKASKRYSARSDNSSGSSTTITAPITGPSIEPAPPTITPNSSRIDCRNGNELGLI